MDAQAFAASWLAEDAPIESARARAAEAGVTASPPSVGSLLQVLAATLGARTVVETGTGTGVSGLWLLRGMRADGVLTSIDLEPDHQRLARMAFADAGVPAPRARFISGDALSVLPRLADHAYDLVLLDSAPQTYPGQLEQAWRLLRPGGFVVVAGVLRGGRGPERGSRDPESVGIRATLDAIKADERLRPALLTLGDGLLIVSAPSDDSA